MTEEDFNAKRYCLSDDSGNTIVMTVVDNTTAHELIQRLVRRVPGEAEPSPNAFTEHLLVRDERAVEKQERKTESREYFDQIRERQEEMTREMTARRIEDMKKNSGSRVRWPAQSEETER